MCLARSYPPKAVVGLRFVLGGSCRYYWSQSLFLFLARPAECVSQLHSSAFTTFHLKYRNLEPIFEPET